jgi:serine/threonine-protein kinase HipA
MQRTLDVYLHRRLVGQLIQDEHGQMIFRYASNWLGAAGAVPLSHSLLLRKETFDRNECRGFFAGLLPEESKRQIIARNLGISARNDFAMLEQIGGECAGAVTFVLEGQSLPEQECSYRPLTSEQLARLLKDLPRRPLMAGEDGVRLSLAGAQDKIAVHVAGNQISLPLGSSPSTHILKPAIEHYEGIVFNEALCMKLAHAIGLPAARTEIRHVEGIDYLLIERYDRRVAAGPEGSPGLLQREHQEDFCQALGIVPEDKYQNEGGPSFKQSFDLVRQVSSVPVLDLRALLDAVIFNFLVGNHDAHGKNFSIIYGRQTRLAPLYDVVSTAYYPELSTKMAMKLGGEYASEKITAKHFDAFADEVGFGKPMVRSRLLELAEGLLANLPAVATGHPVAKALASLVQARCEKTLQRSEQET